MSAVSDAEGRQKGSQWTFQTTSSGPEPVDCKSCVLGVCSLCVGIGVVYTVEPWPGDNWRQNRLYVKHPPVNMIKDGWLPHWCPRRKEEKK